MYSNKENVNILTALLVAHNVRYAVLCPGSRNSPIVHNLNECPDMTCFPVTDERSAGYYALGMSQCLHEPVVVCVTSGTALLNLAPAVAEAYYQHVPLVVVSADRPPQWIDQLDGQTLPQPDALGRFVSKAVSLPEPHNDEERWYCNRLVNEAGMSDLTLNHVVRMFLHAQRPMLICGQPLNPNFDEAVALVEDDERYVPDFVLYTGGSIVSKRVKHFLRKAKETWAVNLTGEVNDTFMNLTHVIQGDGEVVADMIRFNLEQQPHPFVERWNELLSRVRQQVESDEPAYSSRAAVKYFEQKYSLFSERAEGEVHYANSTSIRLANVYARHPIYCNRGVNGIEGSLSTAAGFSCVTDKKVFCVIGDLSFFYDQNALWNQNLRGNLRILLLNNGRGGIFNMLPGLENSPARDKFVAAAHHTSAEGICHQNDVVYMKAENMKEMQQGIDTLLCIESNRPVLLEVFTDL